MRSDPLSRPLGAGAQMITTDQQTTGQASLTSITTMMLVNSNLTICTPAPLMWWAAGSTTTGLPPPWMRETTEPRVLSFPESLIGIMKPRRELTTWGILARDLLTISVTTPTAGCHTLAVLTATNIWSINPGGTKEDLYPELWRLCSVL